MSYTTQLAQVLELGLQELAVLRNVSAAKRQFKVGTVGWTPLDIDNKKETGR